MKKRAAPLFLAVLTACALACPALAAEAPSPEATPSVLYPVEVLEYTEGDRAEPRISKTYELSPMDDPALIPTGDFERSGCLYTLLDICPWRAAITTPWKPRVPKASSWMTPPSISQ